MLEQYDDVLTLDEARELLKIGTNAIYKLLNSGKLKGFRNGKRWLIPKKAIEMFILQSTGMKI